jgi:type IV pilus assembly protein PilE
MKEQQGLNLLELLIVLSIVGTLLAVAIPQYINHLTHTRRLTAETSLMKLAGHMEAFFAEHNTYEGANLNNLKIPEFIAENNYHLVIEKETPTEFKLAAIPQDIQARNDAHCGILLLNSRGEKRIGGYGNLNECW